MSACICRLGVSGHPGYMVMTAVDRFHAVLFALRPALFNRKTCFKIIVVLWVSSVAFHWRCLYELVKGKPGIICAFLLRMELDVMKRQLTSGITWLCLIFVSVTVLIVLYSSISVSLYLQKKSNHLASEIIQQRAKESRRITCMLVVVVAVFYAVWFTCSVFFNRYFLQGLNAISSSCLWWVVLFVLPIIHPVLNPVIYYVFNEDYRKGIKNLPCCPCSCNNKFTHCYHSPLSPQRRGKKRYVGKTRTPQRVTNNGSDPSTNSVITAVSTDLSSLEIGSV